MKYRLKYQLASPTPNNSVAETAEKFHVLSKEAEGLFIEKNNFYCDRFYEFGLSGIVVRLYDKFQGLQSAFENPSSSTEDITEIFLDISNYAILGAILQFYDKPKNCTQHLFKQHNSEKEDELACIFCGAIYPAQRSDSSFPQ